MVVDFYVNILLRFQVTGNMVCMVKTLAHLTRLYIVNLLADGEKGALT